MRQQHAELDEVIALVLSRHAGDPLDVEVDQREALLSTMESQRITRSDARNPPEDDSPVPGEEVRQ